MPGRPGRAGPAGAAGGQSLPHRRAREICAGKVCAGKICAGKIFAGELCAGLHQLVPAATSPEPTMPFRVSVYAFMASAGEDWPVITASIATWIASDTFGYSA